MIVSEKPKFICFQPWKCGSSTLYSRLREYDDARYPQGEYFNTILGKNSHKHIALEDFFKLPESRQNHIRFVFVRNPYDRLYSGFVQRRHRLKNSPPKNMQPGEIKRELRYFERGFLNFCEICLDYFRHDGSVISEPLNQYIYHDNKPAVDFVGFVETFEASFEQVCGSIGIQVADRDNANIRYKENIETAKSFSKARYRYIDKYDRHSIEAVNEIFEKDFQCLGYRFLDPGNLAEDGQPVNTDLSPFSDAILTERFGHLLTFDRRNS